MAGVCKIGMPLKFVQVKFSIFGLEIGLRPENHVRRKPTGVVNSSVTARPT